MGWWGCGISSVLECVHCSCMGEQINFFLAFITTQSQKLSGSRGCRIAQRASSINQRLEHSARELD